MLVVDDDDDDYDDDDNEDNDDDVGDKAMIRFLQTLQERRPLQPASLTQANYYTSLWW